MNLISPEGRSLRTLSDRVVLFFATGAGVGYLPLAPGTWGTVLGVGVFLLFVRMPPTLYMLTLAALCALAAWASGRAEALFGEHDASRIVIDEIAGFLVTMALVPRFPGYLIAGFIAFRFFDIVKPFPAGRIDRRWKADSGGSTGLQGSNGWAVVLDDLVAGVYANVAVRIIAALVGGA